jgi:hypothetical protein
MSINVDIWRNLLAQGVNPEHVLKQACDHEGHLDALPQSSDRDEAIRETVSFIQFLNKLIADIRHAQP